MVDLRMVEFETDKLVGYARNPRKNDPAVEKMIESIREFGFRIPIVAKSDGSVVDGHLRLKAAIRLGMRKVPVVIADDLSEEQIKAFRLLANRSANWAEWDFDLLKLELSELQGAGFNLLNTGFDTFELADIFATKVGKTDPDDAPPVEERAVSVEGDTWILGGHRLTCGDSTKADTVSRALGGLKPHLMVTDPPYGVNYDAAWRGKAGVGSKGAAVGKVMNDGRADWSAAWALFPGVVAYVWHGGLHSSTVEQSLQAAKFQVRSQIIWVKTRPVLSRGAYHWQHEPAFYAVQPGADDRFAPEHEVGSYAVQKGETAQWSGDRKQSTVWFIEHIRSETGHSTQKPVACMQRPIENNSKPGEPVYEPFSGSGTTLIAAEITGRRCLALELSPLYVDVAVRRWQAFTGKSATLESSGATFEAVTAERLKTAPAKRRAKALA